jgi:phage terminase large subunit-like protein
MTSLLDEPLVGSQQPTLLVEPGGVSSAGAEAVELARSAGLLLDPWQELVLEGALAERADGKWAAFECGVVVSRQNGKGAILEARELAGLFLFGEELILHSAHEFKTALEAFRRVLTLVQNTPDLEAKVANVRTSHGEECIELKTGARLRFVARSKSSARGFSGDTVILDEAYLLPSAAMAALLPTLSARPNPQVWYTTSAPPAVDEGSEQIRRLRARAQSSEPGRLFWAEWSNDTKVDPTDRTAWARANPGLGLRIDPEFVDSERQTLAAKVFAVERLGVWLTESESSKIPVERWDELGDDDAACDIDERLVFGVDMPPDRSCVTFAVSDGDVVELAEQVPPDRAVAWMVERWERWQPMAVVLDAAGPAGSLVPDLVAAGVRVEVTRTRDFVAACSRFYDAVVSGTVRHRRQPLLTLAVGSAQTRRVADAWAWTRKSTIDISPLVAASLALFGAQTLSPVEDVDEPKPLVAY